MTTRMERIIKMRKLCLLLAVVMLLLCASCTNSASPAIEDGATSSPSASEPSTSPVGSVVIDMPTPTQTPMPEPEDLYPGELLFKGTPMSWFLNSTRADIFRFFTDDPDNDDAKDIQGGLSIKSDYIESEQIEDFTINGVSLANFNEVEALLGEALYEDIRYGYNTYAVADCVIDAFFGMGEVNRIWVKSHKFTTEDESSQALETWLWEHPLRSSVYLQDIGEYNYDAALNYLLPGTYDAWTLTTSENEINEDTVIAYIFVCRETGEMFSIDLFNAAAVSVDEWYYYYTNIPDPVLNPSQNSNGDYVSADGYIINSGATVYKKGGGWSLFGSVTECVINLKTDGSYTVDFVAVLESMGLYGWERSEIYKEYGTLKVWSPSTKRTLGFLKPDSVSLDQLYIDWENIIQ
jgi:hypothetical protein